MAEASVATKLAYDDEGTGIPVVLLHGLTFDRRTWRPIIERLDGLSVRSIAIDLPAHGASGGVPAPLEEIAAQVHELLVSLAAERPIVVGHSMSAGLAAIYGTDYPARGVVMIDNGLDIRPFGELLRRLEPALRSRAFAQAWQPFEQSLGLERIPEPARAAVLEAHEVKQEVVLGYWNQVLRTEPAELQAYIDMRIRKLAVPLLAVFGRPIADGDRTRFGWLTDVQLEEWVDDGHCVHLVDPDRFAARLRQFVDHCVAAA